VPVLVTELYVVVT